MSYSKMSKRELVKLLESQSAPIVQEIKEEIKDEVKEVKVKAKREPSAYNKFVKENYSKVADLDKKERFTQLSKMWKESKAKK
jgi:hypothetical protein